MSEGIEGRCAGCKRRVDSSKMYFLPGKVVYDKIADMTYPTGKRYCEKCFARIIKESVEVGREEREIKGKVVGVEELFERRKLAGKGVKVFKGEMPAYEVVKHKLSGYIERIRHARARNGAFYKAVKFRGDVRYFYVWDKNLYENIKAGETVEIEFIQTRFPRVVLIKKAA